MHFITLASLAILTAVPWVSAGHNCKCQDPSGTGPQWDGLTEQVCNEQSDSNDSCNFNIVYHGDQHHQCSSSLNCLDSGAFNDRCKALGATGAYCWD